MDPLNHYERFSYDQYEAIQMHAANPYNQKIEPFLCQNAPNIFNDINMYNIANVLPHDVAKIKDGGLMPDVEQSIDNENNGQSQNVEPEEVDSKEHLKPLLKETQKRVRNKNRPKGKTSSYWNKKVADKNFAFYGCTICNISFVNLTELDQHVTLHKGRITSYDIKQRNKKRKKQLKKLAKKAKKSGKNIKKEDSLLDIEIKPEDGYIGSEKAADFQGNSLQENNHTSVSSHPNVNVKSTSENDPKVSQNDSKPTENVNGPKTAPNGTPDDPRLLKLFKCFACHKQFALSYYLKLHVRSHTDEKPYTCAECGESFITASKLGRHNKRMHLAIKFTCRICYRNFNRFENLTRHFDKKHAEDKLDGEPYDYNVILPYLKELEDQLHQKQEDNKDQIEKKEESERDSVRESKEIEQKPKTEDLWADNWSNMEHLHQTIAGQSEDQKPYPNFLDIDQVKQERDDAQLDGTSMLQIVVEEAKAPADQVLVKVEAGQDVKEDVGDVDNSRDDSFSDEDYFPSNTWAATPRAEAEPLSSGSPKPKRKYKREDYPMKCELCDKRIATPGYMKVHMRIHTGEKPFRCYVCDRGFITSSKMHRHVLTHQEFWSDDDERPLKIDESVRPEDNYSDTESRKSEKKKDAIKKTKARINNECKIREQRQAYKAKKRDHACKFCGKRFLHRETMLVHQRSHEGETIVHKCNFCLEVQPDEAALATHEATHVGPKPFLCTECGRCYSKKESMVYHKKSHYPNDPIKNPPKSFICDICSKGFNAQCKLQKHLVTHNMEKFVLKYECPVCAHMFNTKWHIQMHLQTHTREGVISEENRNEILAMVQQNARKIPLKPDISGNLADLMPSDDRSRICNICGQIFQHFYYLEEHLKSHGSKIALNLTEEQEEKKHICPVCNKGFKLGYYLKLHSFTHTKEKPYMCQTCGKGFITKGKLKRHLETHSGLKKYQCHVCYKFFTRPGYLRIHVRTIHGTQDYNFKYTQSAQGY